MADENKSASLPFNPGVVLNTVAAAAIIGTFVFASNVAASLSSIQKDLEYRQDVNRQLEARIEQLEDKSQMLQRRQRRMRRNAD